VSEAPAGEIYRVMVPPALPAEHYPPRVVAFHPVTRTPTEAPLVRWQR